MWCSQPMSGAVWETQFSEYTAAGAWGRPTRGMGAPLVRSFGSRAIKHRTNGRLISTQLGMGSEGIQHACKPRSPLPGMLNPEP